MGIKQGVRLLNENGCLVFSNNLRKFKLDQDLIDYYDVENITQTTMPKDFQRNSKIHQAWVIKQK